MSFFGAMRLYVMAADRIERDLAPLDGGPLPPYRDGAWALWARSGTVSGEVDPLPRVSRVEPGPVRIRRVHRPCVWSDTA